MWLYILNHQIQRTSKYIVDLNERGRIFPTHWLYTQMGKIQLLMQ